MDLQQTEPVQVDQAKFLQMVFWIFVAIEIFIGLGDLFFNHYAWIPVGAARRFFNITREDGLGNWFAATQSFLLGLTAIGIYFRERVTGWKYLGFFYIFIAMDDATKFHERMGTLSQELLPEFPAWFPTYAWHLVVAPVYLAAGLYGLRFLWIHTDRKMKLLIASGAAIVVGAEGLDFIEGMEGFPFGLGEDQTVRHMFKLVEESLESFGVTLAFIAHLKKLTDPKPRGPLTFFFRNGI